MGFGFMLLIGWRLTALMLFLAPVASGPEVTTVITGGEPVYRVPGGQQRAENIRVRDFNAAAKVERAASAGRIASSDACLHYCRYSADTLHPSPRTLDKNDL
jgi:class 3 adenylate cyclase